MRTPHSAARARMRGAASIAAVVLAVSATAACTSDEGGSTERPLTVSQAVPPMLDPAFYENDHMRTLVTNVFDTLVHAGSDGVEPALAESWESSDDATVWTFTIRDDAKFADGSALTAEDVAYSLVRTLTPISADEQQALGVQSSFPKGLAVLPDVLGAAEVNAGEAETVPDDAIVATDEHTVVITLTAPSNDLLDRLANPALSVVQQADVEESAEGSPWWYEPVASGPFQVESFDPDSEVTIVPNPEYYGEAPKLSAVTFKVIEDTQTAIVAWEAGELDIVRVSNSDVKNLQDSGLELASAQDAGTAVMLVNPKGFTSDMHVLRALAMAVDKEAVAGALDDLVTPAYTFTGSNLPGYPAGEFEPLEFDPEAAKAELALSAYSPEEITIRAITLGELDTRAVEVIAQMWEQNLGIGVEILTELPPATAPEAEAANILLLTQGPNYRGTCAMTHRWPDFLVFAAGANNVNFGPIDAPGLTEVVDACSSADSDAAAWDAVVEFEKLLTEYPQFIPAWYGKTYYLVQPDVKNVEFGASWQILDLSAVTIEP